MKKKGQPWLWLGLYLGGEDSLLTAQLWGDYFLRKILYDKDPY